MRLGIMGGTFDPIHLGHLDCARMAQRALALDEVLFMPAACTNFKQGRQTALAADRLEMCRLAVQDEPSWKVSSLEIDRGGTSYTLDTLKALRRQRPDAQLFFITGSDALNTLDRWHGAQELARLACFVAVERPGYGLPAQRRAMLERSGFTLECVVNEGYDISSSEIRHRLEAGEPLDGMVPAAVAVYIAARGLYGHPGGAGSGKTAKTARTANRS